MTEEMVALEEDHADCFHQEDRLIAPPKALECVAMLFAYVQASWILPWWKARRALSVMATALRTAGSVVCFWSAWWRTMMRKLEE